ncbi:MAG TPA: Fe(3+)-hydroxamate ABC transporter permease FhuB, partial [Psychrobacter sp.]|nr:Fe(3+)-hydroxamate ABC transporter permease FhuB [Psychrobacter sp.]
MTANTNTNINTSQTHHTPANNMTNNAKPMTSLSSSQSVDISKHSGSRKQKTPSPPPNSSQLHSTRLAATSWRLWAMLITLVSLSVWSSWALINQEWTRPIGDLFLPSAQLD